MRSNYSARFVIACFVAIASCNAVAKEQFRFVVSTGALADHNPFSAFYQSRIFQSNEIAPFIIANGNARAFESSDAWFFADGDVDASTLSKAGPVVERKNSDVVMGHSFRGFALVPANSEANPIDVEAAAIRKEALRRYLGADSVTVLMEKKRIDNVFIWAISKGKKTELWPTSADEVRMLPAVVVRDNASAMTMAVIARPVGALANRLGLVDKLRREQSLELAWIDMGSNEQPTRDAKRIELVSKRSPLSLFAGTSELEALRANKDAFGGLPVMSPYGNRSHIATVVGKNEIHFWAASGKETMWPRFDQLGKRLNFSDAIASMQAKSADPNRSLNIVRAYSEESAAVLARSVYVDLVLLKESTSPTQLASREIIELSHAKTDAYETIAPIVKVSDFDASVITVYGPNPFTVAKVEVVRHAISDEAPTAPDVALDSLPARGVVPMRDNEVLSSNDFESILGGIMLEETKADIAMFQTLPHVTPVASSVSMDLAQSLVAPKGNLIQITINGRQIKRITKLIASDKLGRKLSVYGLDGKNGILGKRVIGDNERFRVALTEDALLELFGLSTIGGFPEFSTDRAMFISAVYADPKQLFYVSGQKQVPISDTSEEIERAVKSLSAGAQFDDVVTRGLAGLDSAKMQRFKAYVHGEPHHVITFDVAYLDIGLSKNFVNNEYEKASSGFPTSRGNIPPFAHLFLYSKMSLNHQIEHLHTSLFNETKYMHTNLGEKPEKDKTKFGLRFRLPWENSYFEDSSVVLSPIFVNVFETKIAPHAWSNNPEKYKKPRTRRMDSLLGVNLDFTKLGFDIDVGGAMATDFNRVRVRDALDFGPGLNFNGKWRLFGPVELSSDFTSVYLFALPESVKTDKIGLGVEGALWLRFARFYDFSVAASSDFLIATLQNAPDRLVLSSIFGITVSYGRLFRLLG